MATQGPGARLFFKEGKLQTVGANRNVRRARAVRLDAPKPALRLQAACVTHTTLSGFLAALTSSAELNARFDNFPMIAGMAAALNAYAYITAVATPHRPRVIMSYGLHGDPLTLQKRFSACNMRPW